MDDRNHPVRLELLRHLGDRVVGQLGPAVGGHHAVARVEADDDMAGKFHSGIGYEVRLGYRARAEDDVLDAAFEIGLDRGFVANAATHLDRHVAAGRHDFADHTVVDRVAGLGAVEVDDVDAIRALVEPAPGHGHRVLVEDGDVVHAALAQAYALAVLDINRRYE